MSSEQLQQPGQPRRIMSDPLRHHHGTGLVDDRHIMVILGPVDPAGHTRHRSGSPLLHRIHPGVTAP